MFPDPPAPPPSSTVREVAALQSTRRAIEIRTALAAAFLDEGEMGAGGWG
jgi:hypothetical protein